MISIQLLKLNEVGGLDLADEVRDDICDLSCRKGLNCSNRPNIIPDGLRRHVRLCGRRSDRPCSRGQQRF